MSFSHANTTPNVITKRRIDFTKLRKGVDYVQIKQDGEWKNILMEDVKKAGLCLSASNFTPPSTTRNGQPYTVPAYSSKANTASAPIRGGHRSTQSMQHFTTLLPASSSQPRGFNSTTFQDSSYAAKLKSTIVSATITSTPPTSTSTFIPPCHQSNSVADQEVLAAKSLFSSGTNISVRQLDNLVRDDIHGIEALFLRIQGINPI